MSLAQAIAAISWWNGSNWTQTVDPSYAADPSVSADDRSFIQSAIVTAYTGSSTFRTIVDTFVSNGSPIRIATSEGATIGANVRPTPTDPVNNYVIFDTSEINDFYYWNDRGNLVKEIPAISVVHELIHLMTNQIDSIGTESQMNGAAWDFKGDTVRTQNIISAELGYNDNIQSSYQAGLLSNDPLFSEVSTSFNYTNGHSTDITRIGSGGNDDINMTARTDESRDLILGFGGNDTIMAGAGADYIHGGAGDDTLDGGSGADELYGGEDVDFLQGDAGADTIFGDSGNDVLVGYLRISQSSPFIDDGAKDMLYGGAGDDVILCYGSDVSFGGDGNDVIRIENPSNAIVNGGAGTDQFNILTSDSSPIVLRITDSDVDDALYLGFQKLSGGRGWSPPGSEPTQVTDGFDNIYTNDTSSGTLTIQLANGGGSIFIENYESGDLGIGLDRDLERSSFQEGDDPSLRSYQEPIHALGTNSQFVEMQLPTLIM